MNTYTIHHIRNCEKKAWKLFWRKHKALRKVGRKLSEHETSVYESCSSIVKAFSYALYQYGGVHDTSFPSRWVDPESTLTIKYPYYTAVIGGKEIQFTECDLKFYN